MRAVLGGHVGGARGPTDAPDWGPHQPCRWGGKSTPNWGLRHPPHSHPKTAGRAEDWGGQFGGIVWGAGWGRVGPPRTAWGEGSVEQVQRSKLGRVPTPADGVALGAYAGDDVSRGADLRRGSACPLGTSTRRVLHRTARAGKRTPLLHLAGHHVEPERPATSASSGNAGVAGVSGEALKVPGTRVGGGGGCAWGIDQRCRGESTSNRPILLVVSGIDQWSIRALFPQVRPGLVDSASQVSLARVRARLRGVRLCDRPTGRNRPAL